MNNILSQSQANIGIASLAIGLLTFATISIVISSAAVLANSTTTTRRRTQRSVLCL